jgi:hypothetical protein
MLDSGYINIDSGIQNMLHKLIRNKVFKEVYNESVKIKLGILYEVYPSRSYFMITSEKEGLYIFEQFYSLSSYIPYKSLLFTSDSLKTYLDILAKDYSISESPLNTEIREAIENLLKGVTY